MSRSFEVWAFEILEWFGSFGGLRIWGFGVLRVRESENKILCGALSFETLELKHRGLLHWAEKCWIGIHSLDCLSSLVEDDSADMFFRFGTFTCERQLSATRPNFRPLVLCQSPQPWAPRRIVAAARRI